MKKYQKYIFFVAFLLLAVGISAQCPMCRAAAETNLQQGGTEGKGLNKGILYMLTLPYLLISTIGFLWWKNKREESKAAEA
ncbi:MAG: hypothetical protein ACJATI_002316 [Halioglobus sp.]|jgi:hypothetical protein